VVTLRYRVKERLGEASSDLVVGKVPLSYWSYPEYRPATIVTAWHQRHRYSSVASW
jgi:hypothetical protein